MSGVPILSILVLFPVVAAAVVIGLGAEQRRLARFIAFGASLVSLAVAILLWIQFAPANGEMQFEENHVWIPSLGVQYHLGLDGLSLVLVMLSAVVPKSPVVKSSLIPR